MAGEVIAARQRIMRRLGRFIDGWRDARSGRAAESADADYQRGRTEFCLSEARAEEAARQAEFERIVLQELRE